ncbi:MAG TPA: Na+/H+ antiporter NhaA [Bacteroidales bacterium]|nr:Na+/H+ antiporter NhaA [Bacteroidales bacterium]
MITALQKFIRTESLSGIMLLAATVLALLWANSPWADVYKAIWDTRLGFSAAGWELSKPLLLWVNDGLMAVFFFLIGLEIKRELLIGGLNTPRKAILPLFAALGGMLIPITLFLLLNRDPATMDGWGVPMATDIAFSLAILQMLGNRVPVSLKVFLTAFAIVDDIGAVLVIALFYSGGVQWALLGGAGLLLAGLAFLSMRSIYNKYLYFLVAIVVWFLFLKAGVHPTVAGVLMAFTIPLRQRIRVDTFTRRLGFFSTRMEEADEPATPVLTREQIEELDDLEDWIGCVQSPLQHLEHRLHSWVAWFIMPVFALANAGISFSSGVSLDLQLVLAIALSLFVGKTLGVSLFTWLAVRLGLADLPEDFGFRQVLGVGMLAGVGFTMAIFIASLAFAGNAAYLDSAKAGILLGSVVAGVSGYLFLRCARTAQS